MPEVVYLAGYSKRTPEQLLACSEAMGAVVVDIRYKPYSHFREHWRKERLMPLFGSDYIHVKQWGNPNHANGLPMEIADFTGGWERVAPIERPVILLCTCEHMLQCHRNMVGAMLTSRGLCKIHELDWRVGQRSTQLDLFAGVAA